MISRPPAGVATDEGRIAESATAYGAERRTESGKRQQVARFASQWPCRKDTSCVRTAARSSPYGIGQAEVDVMLAAQDHKCAVCGKPDPEHVDHDHTTGAVRGLLCFNCNQALGNVRDSVVTLAKLQEYLFATLPPEAEISVLEMRFQQALVAWARSPVQQAAR